MPAGAIPGPQSTGLSPGRGGSREEGGMETAAVLPGAKTRLGREPREEIEDENSVREPCPRRFESELLEVMPNKRSKMLEIRTEARTPRIVDTRRIGLKTGEGSMNGTKRTSWRWLGWPRARWPSVAAVGEEREGPM